MSDENIPDLPDLGEQALKRLGIQLQAGSGAAISDQDAEQQLLRYARSPQQSGIQGRVAIPLGSGELSLQGLIDVLEDAGVVGGGVVQYQHPIDKDSSVSVGVGGGGSSKYGGAISDAFLRYNKRF